MSDNRLNRFPNPSQLFKRHRLTQHENEITVSTIRAITSKRVRLDLIEMHDGNRGEVKYIKQNALNAAGNTGPAFAHRIRDHKKILMAILFQKAT